MLSGQRERRFSVSGLASKIAIFLFVFSNFTVGAVDANVRSSLALTVLSPSAELRPTREPLDAAHGIRESAPEEIQRLECSRIRGLAIRIDEYAADYYDIYAASRIGSPFLSAKSYFWYGYYSNPGKIALRLFGPSRFPIPPPV